MAEEHRRAAARVVPDPATGELIRRLAGAACRDPFEALGLRADPRCDGLLLTVWRPDTAWIEALDAGNGEPLGRMARVGESDLFRLVLSGRDAPFPYRLRCADGEGGIREEEDPYAWTAAVRALPPPAPVALQRRLGAHLRELESDAGQKSRGVLFAVHAPSARSVSVVGDFNGWDGRRHPMQSCHGGEWRLFVPGLGAGVLYKFELKDPDGCLLPLKSDPFAFYSEQPPGNASIVHDPAAFSWSDGEWCRERDAAGYRADRPVSIYEVHLGSWRRGPDGRHLSYSELAEALIPYAQGLGFTHLELLPVMEHPFAGSWGYQPTAMFAPTSRHGTPDDFRAFVDACHGAGIGVILDWVPGHFPADDHGLARFDGTHLFEHPDPRRGWHPDWDTCVYDFGRPWVRNYLISSALHWLGEFHADGLRVDAVASMLYLDYSRGPGQWIPNIYGGNENLEAVDFLREFNEVVHREFPGALTIAEESTAWPKVSRPTWEGGLGFGYKWNMGWMHDTLRYFGRDPVYRHFHHQDITFSLLYAFDEHFVLPLSHDEVVHGKGSLLGRMPGDAWQKLANLRACLAYCWGHPGRKLLFMGGELGQRSEWNHDGELEWDLQRESGHAGVGKLVADLNSLYRGRPALHALDDAQESFHWIEANDADRSVIAFLRYGPDRSMPVLVVCNLTPVVREAYRLGVPRPGSWCELLNTDAEAYGGSGVGNLGQVAADGPPAHGHPQSLALTLPPLATLFLAPRAAS